MVCGPDGKTSILGVHTFYFETHPYILACSLGSFGRPMNPHLFLGRARQQALDRTACSFGNDPRRGGGAWMVNPRQVRRIQVPALSRNLLACHGYLLMWVHPSRVHPSRVPNSMFRVTQKTNMEQVENRCLFHAVASLQSTKAWVLVAETNM